MRIAPARLLALLSLLLVGLALVAPARSDEDLARAEKLFQDKNYQEAADIYATALPKVTDPKEVSRLAQRLVACHVRLQRFDAALDDAEGWVRRAEGSPWEARARRFAGDLWVSVPHWGTRSGGTFYRGEWRQGIQLRSARHDKKISVAHLEKARDLYAAYDTKEKAKPLAQALGSEKDAAGWHAERVQALFDLAGACARFGIYEQDSGFWWGYWAERDDLAADTAGEEDFQEMYSDWELRRHRPTGLRVGPDGAPLFPVKPKTYEASTDDDQKILYLLDEIRGLDQSDDHAATAMSLYRQGMLARARFGMDRLQGIAGGWWSGDGYPLQDELKEIRPWDLGDDEALVLAGGRIHRVTLPRAWDALALLGRAKSVGEASGLAPMASYAIGLHLQTRQQYVPALAEFEGLRERWPKSDWAAHAQQQIERIRASQVHVNQTSVQMTGAPARIQVSWRNATKVHFVAWRIDLDGFFREVRDQPFDELQGPIDVWSLGNWHAWFTQQYDDNQWAYLVAKKHVGAEVARWSDDLEDDGTHRFAQKTIVTPLDHAGAYLIGAFLDEPPAAGPGQDPLREGVSRAVVVMTDLALVEKPAKEGRLYYVADAISGAPVAGAKLEAVEFWNRWDQKGRKSHYYRATATYQTDENGVVVAKPPGTERYGQVHVLVTAGSGDDRRFAWSGMDYDSPYSPSAMEQGRFAWVATDRPVYRPGHTVRYKVWLRQRSQGLYSDLPNEAWSVTVYDPRGNKVHEATGQTDLYGGFDGSFVVGEEPTLGVYRIDVHGANVVGGQTFRVEEYKKPEFEVTVEPSKHHVKLGDSVTAKITAKYYFGAPVSDADVQYKVFREEYRQALYPGGRWDWLYGPGYGLPWYSYGWFPWWRERLCCWVPPYGWWGGQRANPVRELVQQGAGRISADGTLSVEIETADAKRDHPDRDERYVIEADVRDASRRVISGEGAVVVTRQAWYAFVGAQRGWVRPGEEMVVEVRCVTPDGKPVQTKGLLTIDDVRFGGRAGSMPDDETIATTRLDQMTVETDANGRAEVRFRPEKSGQLQLGFEAPDAWGGTVRGHGLVWVCGEDFEGKLQRFDDLELITDKRTYRPGETAHVMVNAKKADSWVIFADRVDDGTILSWRMVHLPVRSAVVDVPILDGSVPNFFVEATTVANAHVHDQVVQLCVPPEDGMLNVEVVADKATYRPGEKATVRVRATRPDGTPAKAQVTLAAFDRSVLYIQPEVTPELATFFHGRLRAHTAVTETNLLEQLSSWGGVLRPYEQTWPWPEGWFGAWGVSGELARESWAQDELKDMGLDFEGGDGDRGIQATSGFAGATKAPSTPAAAAERSRKSLEAGAAAPPPSGPAGGKLDAAGEAPLVEPEVRTRFADTALWQTTLETGEDGSVETTVEMPENLTTWKVNAWSMTKETRVGQASTTYVTTKNLIVRLQAPRFFQERDEVVLSANVHNYLETAKRAEVSIDLPSELLELSKDTPATVSVDVDAGGEARVDWRVRVLGEGRAAITATAKTDEESDAMRLEFPVLVHGMTKQVASTESLRPDPKDRALEVALQVPDERRPDLTRLEVRYAPTLVGAMLDALPYCLDYPYGCTEQTVSRFLPAVLTRKTLQDLGLSLADLKGIRGRMDEIRRAEAGEGHRIGAYYAESPVFDPQELEKIIDSGLRKIASMEQSDGGWGWWTRDDSNPYLTSYVLFALLSARDADVAVPNELVERGARFLTGWVEGQMASKSWGPSETYAFAAYVLSMTGARAKIEPAKDDQRPGDLLDRLFAGRDRLSGYGKSLLALAFANLKDDERAGICLQNVMQQLERNDETQVAWVRTPDRGWWFWWNNDIETNAWALRALVEIDPKSEVAPRLVKWLLANRKNGYYWRSTRDTTLCVSAMSAFVRASGEGSPDYVLRLDLDDGKIVKEVKISRDNLFTYDSRFVVEGVALSGGKHVLRVTKTGPGAVYLNTYLSYFTKEEPITAAGHELKIERRYFLLKQVPFEVTVEGADRNPVKERRLRYERVPIHDGDSVASGDVIQVELEVTSDNTYTYLAFEDPKPAGMEPVEVRSGGEGQEGFWSYMELRDEKVAFFVGSIDQGSHLLRYRLRAEIPGTFHALPARCFAMYAPELRANSDETRLTVTDR